MRKISTGLAIATALLLAVALLAVTAVRFRDRLADVPLLGPLIAPGAPAGRVDRAAPSWVCPMHPEVRSDKPGTCPKCGMDLVREDTPGVAPAEGAPPPAPGTPRVAVPAGTPESAPATQGGPPAGSRAGLTIDLRRQQLIGVRTATVVSRPIGVTTRTVGIVRYDETRQADINIKVEGFIRDLYVDHTGQPVQRGQPLFTIYSPDLLATQNEYLLALRSRDQLRASQVADARDYAERLAAAARQRLVLWDLSDAEIAKLEDTREPQTSVTFRSPVGGFVIEKRVLRGQRVMAGESLYTVADVSVVWVEADVYEREMALVRQGQAAEVTVDAWPGERFSGRITFIYPYVNEPTRTVRVRAELPNGRGRLKPGMFANVELRAGGGQGLVVPSDAVIDSGQSQFVFVALGDGYFEPRTVRTGHRVGGDVHVIEGLTRGEVVASAATFFIDSESQMRAAMQGFEAPAVPGGTAAPPAAAGATALDIGLRTEPDPPRHGDNTFVVTLKDASGAPVDDADVRVRLYMPPMPSMNMPAMSAEATLLPFGQGLYRGRGNVSMAGRWDTTVTVSRRGERLGTRQFAIVAR